MPMYSCALQSSDMVYFFKGIGELLCIIHRSIFYEKVIHYKREEGVFRVILPNSGCVFDWLVSLWCQVLDELLVCDDSGLLESIHAFGDINVEKPLVVDYVKKAVLTNDLLGDDIDVYLHILGVR